MTAVRFPSKVSQIDRFPTEWAMDYGDEADRAKSALSETSAPVSPVQETGCPIRQTARTEPELDPAA
jgi:hypothetical protein